MIKKLKRMYREGRFEFLYSITVLGIYFFGVGLVAVQLFLGVIHGVTREIISDIWAAILIILVTSAPALLAVLNLDILWERSSEES